LKIEAFELANFKPVFPHLRILTDLCQKYALEDMIIMQSLDLKLKWC